MQRCRSVFLFIFFVSIFSLFAPAVVRAQAGVNWLAAQAQNDGSITTANDPATPLQATAEALRTFRVLGAAVPLASAQQFIADEPFHNTEYLTRKIIAAAEAGQATTTLVADLLNHQNPLDGGFGDAAGYESTVLDTAFALEALSFAGTHTAEIEDAVQFLLERQHGDGGWGDPLNGSRVYHTALSVYSLQFFAGTLGGINAALVDAQSYLLSQRVDSLWTEDYLSALALLSLAPFVADVSLIQPAADALQTRQQANGSWSDDVLSTALALRALHAVNTRGGGTTGTQGAITGTVVLSGSGQPIADAVVALNDNDNIAVTTLTDGRFLITGLTAGTRSLSASKPGYSTSNAIAVIRDGLITDVGLLVLSAEPDSGILSALFFDTDSQSPVANVNLALTGPQSISTSSNSGGRVELAGLTPGNYSFTADQDNYYGVTGNITITAGQIAELRQPMLRLGAFQDPNPITLSGRVLDAETGQSLAGAVFEIDRVW